MKFFFECIFILLIIKINSILPDEKREELLKKFAKKIFFGQNNNINNNNNYYSELNEKLNDELYSQANSVPIYEMEEIRNLIKKNGFPESYNFIKDTKVKPHIKHQGRCSSCWAIAATSALAYRYYKKGIDIDLSPQHELSCYKSACIGGNNLIDPQLSLIINGTLTEQCLPYSSENGDIEQCPKECKDKKIPYKKYFAKNAYTVQLNKYNIYNITTIIIDQLITQGPVMTSVLVYEDLDKFIRDENCPNMIYTYDGKSNFHDGHALVIVGYNFTEDKYYWIVENSYGEEFCDKGYFNIEFGQAGIGSVSFAEPVIENEREESNKLVEVKFVKRDKMCNIEIDSESNLNNWKSQLIIIYEHETEKFEFDYICGVSKLSKNSPLKIYCNYENENIYAYKGLFKYKTFRTNGKINNFVLDSSFINTQFIFYGNDKINHLGSLDFFRYNNNKYVFISNYSRIIYFLYQPIGNDLYLPAISPNEYTEYTLSRCNRTNIIKNKQYISYCDITEEEMKYFDGENRMVSQGLCGINYYRNIIPRILDETKYPIFKIKSFELDKLDVFEISATINSQIIGNIEGYNGTGNSFSVLIFIEYNITNHSEIMNCEIGSPSIEQINSYDLKCQIFYFYEKNPTNVYLTPYYGITELISPFQIIIDEEIKAKNNIKSKIRNLKSSKENSSFIMKSPFSLLILLLSIYY